jgi:hyperosmotically inducible protein
MKYHPAFLVAGAAAASLSMLLGACGPAPQAAVGERASTTQVADVVVTTNVKTALLRDETLKAYDISVSTIKGDVLLSGIVDNQAQIDAANRLARTAEGAHSVHDQLTLRK